MGDYDALFQVIKYILEFFLVMYLLKIIGNWLIFKKAGREGWPALVPIYNEYVLCKITGVTPWWLLISYVGALIPVIGTILAPLAGIYFNVLLCVSTARSYGKSDSWAIGLFFLEPLFMFVLGIDSSTYEGMRPLHDPIMEALGVIPKTKEEPTSEKTSPPPKYCPNCGSSVIENSKFCVSCGKEL